MFGLILVVMVLKTGNSGCGSSSSCNTVVPTAEIWHYFSSTHSDFLFSVTLKPSSSPCILSVRYQDSMWACQNLPACFLYLLKALEDYASVGFLPHFFVPECNLFSSTVFPRKTLAFLINALQEQRREGLPLLKPPGPVPPLRQLSLLAGSSIEEEESTQPTHQMTTFQCSNTTFMHKILLMVAALVFALFVVINGKWGGALSK